MMQAWMMIGGLLAIIAGAAWLLRRRVLTRGQQQQVLNSHKESQQQIDAAETEADEQLQVNATEAQTDLRALAQREQREREELEKADTEESILIASKEARRRWDKTIQSPWWIGLVLLLSYLFAPTAHAATKAELLVEIKGLTSSLNDCANLLRRERILHRKTLKDKEVSTRRRLKQQRAVLTQCRKESLIYRTKPPGNTGLVAGITIASTVAVVSLALLFTSIYKPEIFGNARGAK